MKLLTESQAWELIADCFHTPPEERGIVESTVASLGLCNAIYTLYIPMGCISYRTRKKMEYKLAIHALGEDDYEWGIYLININTRESELIRGDFAYLLSLWSTG